jgi:hypothetical protein
MDGEAWLGPDRLIAMQQPQSGGSPPVGWPPQGYGSPRSFPGGYSPTPNRGRNALPILAGLGVVGLVLVVIAGALIVGRPSGIRATPTSRANQTRSDELDAAVRDLAKLSGDVDSLGTQARKALSNLSEVNDVGLQAAWDAGWNNVNSIDAEAADLNARLQCADWEAGVRESLATTYSTAVVDRYHQVCLAVASVAPLHDDWQGIVDGSGAAMQVVDDLDAHDSIVADAMKLATSGRYPEALARLSKVSAAMSDATTTAHRLAATTDVSTLTDWLTRTKAMDDALRALWQSMIDSKGVVTKQVATALRAVASAKAGLPDTTGVRQVVVLELAASVNADGLAIEAARGELDEALSALQSGTVGVSPSAS